MTEQKKYEFVDALRGIAILGVILPHIENTGIFGIIGQYGVQLFFVVSAFTLFLSMDAKFKVEHNPIRNFFIRRFFRIAPAFYLAALFYLLKNGLNSTFWAPNGIHFWQIVTTLSFLHGWHPESINTVVPGGWSIADEFMFYLFVPLCYQHIKEKYQALSLAFLLLVVGLFLNGFTSLRVLSAYPGQDAFVNYFIQLWFPAQVCVFPLGFFLYFLFRERKDDTKKYKSESLRLILISIFLWLAFTRGGYVFLLPNFMYGLSFVIFAYALSLYPFRFFVNPVICYIGKLSFSMYLFHFAVIGFVKNHLMPLISSNNQTHIAIFFYLAVLFITTGVATVTYYLIEKPGQTFGRKIIEYFEKMA
ncbi:acyltransferase family protein [Leptospira meyeri]|uniref:acyltransferase family protein n=1 Tax=Leptospira meyeri TaxID=29508 RepID=UPI00223DCE25|nr:acyltransferase [Leptospira meyeri]MCW7490388.1 acyltransferase [Leptospira meyeri]